MRPRAIILLALAGCGGTSRPPAGDARPSGDARGEERVDEVAIFRFVDDGRIYSLRLPRDGDPAEAAGPLTDLSEVLDRRISGGGQHEQPQVSRNGAFFTVIGRDGQLWLAPGADPTALEQIEPIALPPALRPIGRAAISNSGDLIVYEGPGCGGGHGRDLYRLERDGGTWGEPACITAGSPELYNGVPRLGRAQDGGRGAIAVLFQCGNNDNYTANDEDPASTDRNHLCEAQADGTALRKLVDSSANPVTGATGRHTAKSVDETSDGWRVFEADWNRERLWKLAPGATWGTGAATDAEPVQVGDFGNDNTPCVLPGDRVLSLWKARTEQALHELKLMSLDAPASYVMVVADRDVYDAGLVCAAITDRRR